MRSGAVIASSTAPKGDNTATLVRLHLMLDGENFLHSVKAPAQPARRSPAHSAAPPPAAGLRGVLSTWATGND
jgi:hypothetical protein